MKNGSYKDSQFYGIRNHYIKGKHQNRPRNWYITYFSLQRKKGYKQDLFSKNNWEVSFQVI